MEQVDNLRMAEQQEEALFLVTDFHLVHLRKLI